MIVKKLLKEKAQVTLLEGPVVNPLILKRGRVVKFRYYDELKGLFLKELKKKYFAVVHAAAVSDYQPAKRIVGKISSKKKTLTLVLVPTQKLINRIKKVSPKTVLVGFKLQPGLSKNSAVKYAKELIEAADCDLVVANKVQGASYKGYLINKQLKAKRECHSRKAMAASIVAALKGFS